MSAARTNPELLETEPTQEMIALRRWAEIKRDLREASAAVLDRHGITWDALGVLETEASLEMGSLDLFQTEYGIVQKIPDKPIQYRLRKSAEDTAPTIFKTRLKLNKEPDHAR